MMLKRADTPITYRQLQKHVGCIGRNGGGSDKKLWGSLGIGVINVILRRHAGGIGTIDSMMRANANAE